MKKIKTNTDNTDNMEPAILFTIPEKKNDPTFYTAQWARNGVKLAKNLGYNTIELKGDQTTHSNATKVLGENENIIMWVHYGHGCYDSAQGNNECIINKEYSLQEIRSLALSGDEKKIKIAKMILQPSSYLSYLTEPTKCQMDGDPCKLHCAYESNVGMLRNKSAFLTACFAAGGLGEYAVNYGANSFIGSDDLFLFPVDSLGSQTMYEYIQLIGLKERLLGRPAMQAEKAMSDAEDKLIRMNVDVEYIVLTMIHNKLSRKVLGNPYSIIFDGFRK